ncbi:MAG TPA: hypothetical protein DDY78_07975 [Planctomycetales bacterium]|jgi:hypothetical protein|nr:hypothetical protein [Planctomycetales bacterium]
MQPWRDQIRQHPYPHDLDHIAQEFGPQLDYVSCGVAAVHHGLLLGGLTIPKAALQAIFRVHPDPGPSAYGYVDEERLPAVLKALGFSVEERYRRSRESTPTFLERLGPELDRGAFAIASIYLYEGTEGEYSHWVTLGRWKDGRIRVADSAWYPIMYSLTPKAFDDCVWGNNEDGYGVILVRPDTWRKNYEEWLPARDRLLRLEGRSLEASATMSQLIQHAAAHALEDDRYAYEQLEFYLSGKSSLPVNVSDGRKEAIAVSTPTADERYGQVVVVRRLAQGEPGQPGPPELVFRMSELSGWQLG